MLPCPGQDEPDSASAPDSGGTPPRALPVAGAQQDAEAAREKLLKASDELDMIQTNSETTKVDLDRMKADITQLQSANADLKQQLAAMQAALDKAEAARIKERQVLVDEVAQLLATRSSSVRPSAKHHEEEGDMSTTTHASADSGNEQPTASTEVHHSGAATHASDAPAPDLAPPDDPAPSPKPQKGYYHVVESGETLTMICAAYREQGVKVSLAAVKKANGLSSKGVLKVGQKLFIPQPGT